MSLPNLWKSTIVDEETKKATLYYYIHWHMIEIPRVTHYCVRKHYIGRHIRRSSRPLARC